LLVRALLYIVTDIGELSAKEVLLERQNIEGSKNYSAFLVHPLAELDEIWHNEWSWCVADLRTLVNFGPLLRDHKFSTADIWHIFVGVRRKLAGLGRGKLTLIPGNL